MDKESHGIPEDLANLTSCLVFLIVWLSLSNEEFRQ